MSKVSPDVHLTTELGARYYPPLTTPTIEAGRTEPLRLHNGSTSRWRSAQPKFDFIDLFAGIGGFRIAFELEGGNSVFSSEWNDAARTTYQANFGEWPYGDIRECKNMIPRHDILVAGFPCQPFSIAGVSKKNSLGRQHGFKDKTQGTLFFELLEILDRRRPSAFVLENVKNLRSHDKGRTYYTVINSLRELGYHVFDKVIDAQEHVPQHRERIFIVGFREFRAFDFPAGTSVRPKFRSILEKKVPDRYFMTPKLWLYLQKYAEKHRAKGNGFGCSITAMDGVARTLSARYYKDGSEVLIDEGRPTPRRLTPRECANLMGFPSNYKIVCSDTQAYKQFGNAVVVPVARAVARNVVKALGFNARPRRHESREIRRESVVSAPAGS